MSGSVQALAVVGAIAALLAAMVTLRRVARARGWPAEVQRKLVHVAAGTLATGLPWLFADRWPIWLLLGLTAGAMIAMRAGLLSGAGATLHGIQRKSWGELLLVAAVALLLLLYEGRAVLYVLPLLVLTLSDAAAALAGSSYGRNVIIRPDGQKSIEGSVVFFLITLLLSMICLLLLSQTPRVNVVVISVALASFATLLEADSWHGFDNLFLPMGVLFFLGTTLDVPAEVAMLDSALILLAMTAMYGAARALGQDGHVARVHALAAYMVVAAVGPADSLLPMLALLAHAVSAQGAARAALTAVAGLALVSFGFLGFGTAAGVSAINAYGLAAAAMALGFGTWALAGRGVVLRLGTGLVGAVVLCALWRWSVPLNPHAPPVAGAWLGGAILAATASAVALWPGAVRPAPVLRVTLMAVAPALALYLWSALPLILAKPPA